MTRRSCGEDVAFLLAEHGVDLVFGMPGVHSLELYRRLDEAGITHVSVRHEQGAGFMADGYARASGRPGVALLISGPGVSNAATAVGQAYSDSVPLLLLTPAIALEDLGLGAGALHEIRDQRGLTAPITGLSALAHTPAQVPELIGRAFAGFATRRPRPAHVSVPLDVLEAPAAPRPRAGGPAAALHPPGPDPAGIRALADALQAARAPLVLAGGGAAGAAAELRALVEASGATFVATIAGKGIVPDDHPHSLGATLQRPATRRAVAEADFVLAVGTEIAEPDLYVTADTEAGGGAEGDAGGEDEGGGGGRPQLRLSAGLGRIDIDPDVMVRPRPPDIGLVSDARLALRALLDIPGWGGPDRGAARRAAGVRSRNAAALSPLERVHDGVLQALRRALPPEGLVYADMCQIAYTGCLTFPVQQPGRWHFPMGFGTLGYALPAAIGGKLACPWLPVVALVGDGGLQFTVQELATAAEHRLALPIVLWDNDGLAEIEVFMRARQIPPVGVRPPNPDFAALARAYGLRHAAPDSHDAIAASLTQALRAPGPTLIQLRQAAFTP